MMKRAQVLAIANGHRFKLERWNVRNVTAASWEGNPNVRIENETTCIASSFIMMPTYNSFVEILEKPSHAAYASHYAATGDHASKQISHVRPLTNNKPCVKGEGTMLPK